MKDLRRRLATLEKAVGKGTPIQRATSLHILMCFMEWADGIWSLNGWSKEDCDRIHYTDDPTLNNPLITKMVGEVYEYKKENGLTNAVSVEVFNDENIKALAQHW